MSWVAVGVTVGGAGLGFMENQRTRKLSQDREDRSRMENAAQTETSWARKDGRGTINPVEMAPIGKSDLGAGLQGGLAGFMAGSSIGKSLKSPATPTPGGGGGALGGDSYASALGDQGKEFSASMPAAYGGGMQPPAGGPDWDQMGAAMGVKPNFFSGEKPNMMSYNRKPLGY
jgi:hypothetical protein